MENLKEESLIRSTPAKRNPELIKEKQNAIKVKKLIDHTEQELQVKLLREVRIIRKTVRWFYGLTIISIVLISFFVLITWLKLI